MRQTNLQSFVSGWFFTWERLWFLHYQDHEMLTALECIGKTFFEVKGLQTILSSSLRLLSLVLRYPCKRSVGVEDFSTPLLRVMCLVCKT